MEIFVNTIADHPVYSKINVEEINKLLASRAYLKRFPGIDKWNVTFVAREPDDYVFDTWGRKGEIYLTIPLVYADVARGTEEEVTRLCGELFDHYVKGLQADYKTEAMEFFITKIVDHPVASKINLEEIRKLLASMERPGSFQDVEKWIVAFVAREPDDYVFETWRESGKVYLTIPLVYEEVLMKTEEEVTRLCGELFGHYLKELQEEG